MRRIAFLLLAAIAVPSATSAALRWRQVTAHATNHPTSRHGLAMAWVPGRTGARTLMTGGCGLTHCDFGDEPQFIAGDTWTFDGATWTRLETTNPPAPRWLASASAGPGGRFLVHGGLLDAQPFHGADAWALTGSAWLAVPAAGVGARRGAAAAYDDGNNTAYLFGGRNSSNVDLQSIWRWTETGGWQALGWSGDDPDTGRYLSAMAFDEDAGKLVIFGGAPFGTVDDDETFVVACTETTCDGDVVSNSAGPVGRIGHGLAWHEGRGNVLLFGGHRDSAPSGDRNDLWAWDGATWTELHVPNPPPPRQRFGMAYDADLDAIVVFGGSSNGTPLSDTWILEDVTVTPDGGAGDAGDDAGSPDAGSPDAGSPDGGDAGPADSGMPRIQGETFTSPYGCASLPAAALAIVGLLFVRRRRR